VPRPEFRRSWRAPAAGVAANGCGEVPGSGAPVTPELQQYERDTWYDRNGRIVFTASKGLTGVGFPRKGSGRGPNKTTGWEDISDMTTGTVSRSIIDDTLPGGPVERTITYEAPFDRCDRVGDYRVVWSWFDGC
jgi:hypothetical protein